MTENKRFINDIDIGQLIDTKGELSTIDYSDSVDFYELWEFLNKLAEENEQLKKILNELSDMLQFDVENGIRSYPVKLCEYLSNALKELQE